MAPLPALSPRCCTGNVNGAGRGIQGEGPCFFHMLRKFVHRVRMSESTVSSHDKGLVAENFLQSADEAANAFGGGLFVQGAVGDAQVAALAGAEGRARDHRHAVLPDESI